MSYEITADDKEELKALASFNDALDGPTAIHRMHLSGDDGPNYQALADAGLVKIYARAPKGWGSKKFFGARITKQGRAALSN